MTERILRVTLNYVGVTPGPPAVAPLEYATESHIAPLSSWLPAGRFIEGRVIQPGLIERSMYGAGRLRGASPVAGGAIVLANADGALDEILGYSFDGQVFYVQELNLATMAAKYTICQGYLEQPTWDEETITFQCRSIAHALDINLLEEKYAGTNALPTGIEGTPNDIGGLPKPVLLGTCYNVMPVQVNTSKKIYQLDGVRGLRPAYTLTVFDKRAVIMEDSAGDYTDQADMEANSPATGKYRVWPAGGCFRINFTPVGMLTCDVMNPADYNAPGTTPTGDSTLTQVLTTMNREVLALPRYGLDAFHPLSQLYAADPDVGIYVQDTRTALTAVNDLLASVGGCLINAAPMNGAYSGDRYSTAQLYEPSAPYFTPAMSPLSLTDDDLIPGSLRLIPPNEPERGLPVWRVNVQYAKNWTLMTANDLAGVAADQLARWTQEYLTASAEDATVKDDWPQALELTVTTLLVDQTEAQAEAQRLLDLFGVPRQRFALSIPRKVMIEAPHMGTSGNNPSNFVPGVRVTLTLDRFGLGSGKTFVITEMRDNVEQLTIDLVIWG